MFLCRRFYSLYIWYLDIVMKRETTKPRKVYLTPDAEGVSLEYDCIIAQSSLEDIVGGDDWNWEN